MSPEERKRLSKFLSLVLRHEPEKLGLRLDEDGFVPLAGLLGAFSRRSTWKAVTEDQIREVVSTSDKRRFEITGDRIRARYGHSIVERVTYPSVEPPSILYHGTSPHALPAILREGLKPMRRQYVHLSTELSQALAVGRRHARDPVLLVVHAYAAWESGVRFYLPEPRLYVAEAVPPQFLERRQPGS